MIKFNEMADSVSVLDAVKNVEKERMEKAGFRYETGMIIKMLEKPEEYTGSAESMIGAAMIGVDIYDDGEVSHKQVNIEYPLPGVFKTLNISGGFHMHSVNGKAYEKTSEVLALILGKKVKLKVTKIGYMIAGKAAADGQLVIGSLKYPFTDGTLIDFEIIE